MTTTIPPEFERFVEQEIARGHYHSAAAVISEGLRKLRASRPNWLADGKTDLVALAAEQGISPIQNADELVGDFWPEEEDVDHFNAEIQRLRHRK